MSTDKKPRGYTVQLEKQLREQQEVAQIREARIKELERRVHEQGPTQVVWATRLRGEFDYTLKAQFIREHKERLKALFQFADEKKRRLKKPLYESIATLAVRDWDEWVLRNTGNEWRVRDLTLVEGCDGGTGTKVMVPEEDRLSLTFSHPGHLESKIGSKYNPTQTTTPKPTEITISVSILRHEVELL